MTENIIDNLFNRYQETLAWIDRRCEEKVLKRHNETIDNWKHAKEVAFNIYQSVRQDVPNGVPSICKDDNIIYDKDIVNKVPKLILEDGREFEVVSILKYRGLELPIYMDEVGASTFVVIGDTQIGVTGLGGEYDWYYMIDKILDKI